MNKYTNEYCEEVARLGSIEGLTYRLNKLIKINDTTLHELDDEIKFIKKEIETLNKNKDETSHTKNNVLVVNGKTKKEK
jgi:phage host-nuclease inhibitor protein Gam